MEVRVHGPAPTHPFEAARARFEAVREIEKPVAVEVTTDPAERTRTTHGPTRHRLTVSESVVRSAIATEILLHEFAHMHRFEERHASHTVDTREAFFLASAGYRLEGDAVAHTVQIANHVRDIYADDITFEVTDGKKLASFLESELATAIADRPRAAPTGGYRLSADADPGLTAVNAAFALALLDRHGISSDHRLGDLAHAAQTDAPVVDLERFRRQFRELEDDPDERACLRTLVDLFEAYFETRNPGREN